MFEELERLVKRLRLAALVAPALLFLGAGLGKLTHGALALPESEAVRVAPVAPRIEIDALGHLMRTLRDAGEETVNFVALYKDHVAPVEHALKRRGVSAPTARRLAWPLVEMSYQKKLDPATVASVLILESGGDSTATSFVGARGLMQVMPTWAGTWRSCGRNLYRVDDNLCNGTSILAWYYRKAGGDERKALLGYNGCVRGTNTPNCFTYPDKISKLRRQIQADMDWYRRTPATAAASP